MSKLYIKGNYIIAERPSGMSEYSQNHCVYKETSVDFTIKEDIDTGILPIPKSEIDANVWTDEGGTVIFTQDSMRSFLQWNAGTSIDSVLPDDLQLYRHLDTVGNGTGTKLATGNYAAAVTDFFIKPPVDETYFIETMIFSLRDTGSLDADSYGNGVALTNGIKLLKKNSGGGTIVDFFDSMPVKSNAEYGSFLYDVNISSYGVGDEFLDARLSFIRAGKAVTLNGALGESLAVQLEDDLTGLNDHRFIIQGYSRAS